MLKKPLGVFFILCMLGVIVVLIDLPSGYRLNFSFFGFTVDRVLQPVELNTVVFGVPIQKSFRTRLGLDLAGGTHIGLEADMEKIPESNRDTALESVKQVIERRVNFFGVSEPIVQTAKTKDSFRILVELPGITNTQEAINLIGQTAQLELREFTDPEAATGAAFVIPDIANTESVGVTGADLKSAQLSFNSQDGKPEVLIEFTSEGAKKFGDVTTRLVGKQLPIFLDNQPLTWPRVSTPITDGRGVITGGFTTDQAKNLSLQLSAGALPVPVQVVEKRTVGALLSSQTISSNIRAGIIGLSLVGFFMILKYGKLGLIADAALVYYAIVTYAIFRWIPVTLTLPGIAGFFLSVGMAVDANILIFERFREELRRGRPYHIAMELGFGKAWDSIRDANIATIITSLILYNPGNWQILPTSGLVRGFAATLLIGVIVSLFTGIVVTRTLIRVFYKNV